MRQLSEIKNKLGEIEYKSIEYKFIEYKDFNSIKIVVNHHRYQIEFSYNSDGEFLLGVIYNDDTGVCSNVTIDSVIADFKGLI